MRTRALSLLICLMPGAAWAANTSIYTPFDLKQCAELEKADGYVFEGAWRCKGIGGYDILQSGVDARSTAGFGRDATSNCAFKKTFGPFNTALSPVEWRLKGKLPIAAIERWSVVKDPAADKQEHVTWLVVNKLEDGGSCHMHYVSGSYPDANEAARRAADGLSERFDCMTQAPTFESTVGSPPIELKSCMELELE
jgi:hypothetical protein